MKTLMLSRMQALMVALLWCLSSAAGAGLIHDYQLNGSYADALGGPDLADAPGSPAGSLTVNPGYYTFGMNEGLTLSSGGTGAGFAPFDVYSIQIIFNFSTIDGYRKILDFKNKTASQGLYNHDGKLDFFSASVGFLGDNEGGVVFATGVDADIVLTRDSAGTISGYFNGALVPQFSFNDGASDAVFSTANNLVRFFEADNAQEASAGAANCIRIYDAALTATEVAAAHAGACIASNNVPEPATLAMLGIGLAGLGFSRRKPAQVSLRND